MEESGRYARDVMFSIDTIDFNPTVEIDGLTHRFDQIINIYNLRGFEANILYIIQIDNVDYVIGQLDFVTAETDKLKYFRCKIIQDSIQARLKRHVDTKIDL